MHMTVVETIKNKIKDNTLSGQDLPAVLDAIVAIVKENEDTKELLEDMAEEDEEVRVNFIISGMDPHHLEIAGGNIVHQESKSDDPTVDIITDPDTAVGLIAGKIDATEAYGAGKVKVSGNLARAMSLVLVLNVVADTFGIEAGM